MYLKDEKQPGESRAKLLKDGETPKKRNKRRKRDRRGSLEKGQRKV